MKNNKNFPCFNDGVVSIYKAKPKKTDFNAKKNVSALDDLDFLVKLDYEESAKREQDIEFAEQMSFSLSVKLHTRYVPVVNNNCKAVIDGYLYDVKYVDKTRSEMWLYLEGVRSIDT